MMTGRLVSLCACLVLLVALVAAKKAHVAPMASVFSVKTIRVEPSPVPELGEGHAVINGTVLSGPILAGRGHVTVFHGGRVYLHRVMDLCKELVHHDLCPLQGDVELRVPLVLPRDRVATGQYEALIELWVHEASGDALAARVRTPFEVAPRANVANCASCGTIMTYTSGGCPAYSNGPDQGTGNSCAGQGAHGLQYQCVELVQRCWNTWFPVDYASQMCDKHPSNFCPTNNPKEHDIYVTAAYTYGHTAIVQRQDGGYVDVVEQNASCGGQSTYSMSGAECFLTPC